MNNNKVIVETIDRLAKSRTTTIKQVEKALGFGNGMIGKWAKAPKSPPIDKLSKIADYFSVPLEYLLTGAMPQGKKEIAPTPKGESDNEKLLIELFRQLSPERQEEELAYLTQAAKRGAGRDM